MRTKELFAFIQERHRIYERRQAGYPKPWTKDPILLQYRFCNVYRELDTVTEWIAENWRNKCAGQKHLWFAMAVARLVNWPDTLAVLTPAVFSGVEVRWNSEKFLKVMAERKRFGGKVFSGAYIVSTNGRAMDKAEYLVQYVLNPLWEERDHIKPKQGGLLDRFHQHLTNFNGMGSFIAAQVVADAKYARPLDNASDWWTWAASGPGSRRGMNRVMGYELKAPWNEDAWRYTLRELQQSILPMIAKAGMPTLHAQDLQNCLCEFDKYERVRLGEGRPRSLYPGA